MTRWYNALYRNWKNKETGIPQKRKSTICDLDLAWFVQLFYCLNWTAETPHTPYAYQMDCLFWPVPSFQTPLYKNRHTHQLIQAKRIELTVLFIFAHHVAFSYGSFKYTGRHGIETAGALFPPSMPGEVTMAILALARVFNKSNRDSSFPIFSVDAGIIDILTVFHFAVYVIGLRILR